MRLLDKLKGLYFGSVLRMHARLWASPDDLFSLYGRPIDQQTGVTVGFQRFETVLTFQTGSGTALCSLIDEQLVRLQISAPPGSKLRPGMVEEIKKSYSDTWVDLSGKSGLPSGVVLFVSDKDGVTIEVFQETAIAITLTRYFPMPAWLRSAAPPPQPPLTRAPATAAQIGANIALAPRPPVSDEDSPRFFRLENSTTVEGQGWQSLVLRDLDDVDSLLKAKHFRPPDAEMRNSLLPGEIKELWFHGISPEPNLWFIVYVVVFFKNPSGQLHARGWFTMGRKETAAGQKPQCEEFRDSAVKHYREVLNSLWGRAPGSIPPPEVVHAPEPVPRVAPDPVSFSTPSWMRSETLAESPAGISVYHLINPNDVEEFSKDPEVSRASITRTRDSMTKREIKHVVEEIPSDNSLNPRLCIYVVVFWFTGAGRRETRICATLGKNRAKQLELCEAFRRTWYETFTGLQNFIQESVQAALAENTENPQSTEGLPLALAGTKEITIKAMGDDRHFALMNTGEVNALLEELGESAKEIARVRDKTGRGEIGSCTVRGNFNRECFVFFAAFYRRRVGVLASFGLYAQGPESTIPGMEAYCAGAQREALERFQEFKRDEAQNN